jgi:hypothetical protein
MLRQLPMGEDGGKKYTARGDRGSMCAHELAHTAQTCACVGASKEVLRLGGKESDEAQKKLRKL